MKHLSHFSEVEVGDKLYTVEDVFRCIGGLLYCLAGTTLVVQEVFDLALKACPEGGTIGHMFVGISALKSLRIVSKTDLHSMQNDSRKDGKPNKPKRNETSN